MAFANNYCDVIAYFLSDIPSMFKTSSKYSVHSIRHLLAKESLNSTLALWVNASILELLLKM